jgi:ATP-dependent RNA circularization protein (DNA/RNA ligase family)
MSKICNGLIKEDYEYHLSGDCLGYCHCVVTNKRCVGMTVQDPDDNSSQFFSRGKNVPVESKLKVCPMYGLSVETFQLIVKEKTEKELNEKLNSIGK